MRKGETYFSDFDKTIKRGFTSLIVLFDDKLAMFSFSIFSFFIKQNIKEVKPLFDCFVKVIKIGFPFSHSARRPFSLFLGENEADIFEVTDIERRPRSNF